jgi:hypothetical protein
MKDNINSKIIKINSLNEEILFLDKENKELKDN